MSVAELMAVAELTVRARVTEIVEGPLSSGLVRRYIVATPIEVFDGTSPETLTIWNGEWLVSSGMGIDAEGVPWLYPGDEAIFFLVDQRGDGPGTWVAWGIDGQLPTNRPFDRPPNRPITDQLGQLVDPGEVPGDRFDDLLHAAAELVASGQVVAPNFGDDPDLVEPLEAPDLIAELAAADGSQWQLWAAPSVLGVCWAVVPASEAQTEGTDLDRCLDQASLALTSTGLVLSLPIRQEPRLVLGITSADQTQIAVTAEGQPEPRLVEGVVADPTFSTFGVDITVYFLELAPTESATLAVAPL